MAEVKTEPSEDATVQKNQSRSSNLCCYSQRVCNLEKLKGFDFCHKHILEDKASPFKPCDFYAKINDKRCMNPAPKMPDNQKSYCLIHTRKAELRRAVEKRKKKRQREQSSTVEGDGEGSGFEKRRRTSSSASQKSLDGSQREDEAQSSDEELSTDLGAGGSLKVDSAWHGDIDSDAESVDSEEEDYLRHAGTWTVDEVSKMCVDKMTRLKSLYMAQYKRLFHVLKEKRRKYLQLIQAEQENEGERYVSPSEVLGMFAHSKKHGVEAILHKQAKEKRHGITPRHQSSTHQRCTHASDGIRCSNKILPLTKFCIHHISHDPNQLLFESCSFKTGDDKTCSNVVPKVYSYSTCQLHMRLAAEPTRSDVENDLKEASKRDLERKEGELQSLMKNVKGILKPFPDVSEITKQGAQLPIPKALQQKSSALIPPLAPVIAPSDPISTPETSGLIRDATVNKAKHAIPHLKLEKMDVESATLEPSPIVGSSESTPMELMSPASGASTPAGVKSISPTLLAASLVAVCSATPSPSVTSAQATSSSDLTNVVKETFGMASTASLETLPSGTVRSVSSPASSVLMTSVPSGSQCTVSSTSASVVPSESSTCTTASTSISPSETLSATSAVQSQSNAVTSTLISVIPSEPLTVASKTTTVISPSTATSSCTVTPSEPHTATPTAVIPTAPTAITSTSSTIIPSDPSTVTSDAQGVISAERVPRVTDTIISGSMKNVNDSNGHVLPTLDTSKFTSLPTTTCNENKSTTKKDETKVPPCPNSSTATSITSQRAETAASGVETSKSQSVPSEAAVTIQSSTEMPSSLPLSNVGERSEPCDKVDMAKDS